MTVEKVKDLFCNETGYQTPKVDTRAAVFENGKILGYANTFKDRAAYDWSVETTIYVKKDIRHHGICRKLYEALENALKEQNIINLNACIAYTETEDEHLTNDSVNYHEHLGYSLVGTFHKCGYKFGKWYDMVWMEKMLGEHPDKPLAVVGFPKIKKFKSSQNLHKKISTHLLLLQRSFCLSS